MTVELFLNCTIAVFKRRLHLWDSHLMLFNAFTKEESLTYQYPKVIHLPTYQKIDILFIHANVLRDNSGYIEVDFLQSYIHIFTRSQ
jgi:hypothetical protein